MSTDREFRSETVGRCSTCPATWTGHRPGHCCVCHETFSSDTNADAHRRGRHGIDRRCVHPGFLGMVYSEPRRMWQMPDTGSPYASTVDTGMAVDAPRVHVAAPTSDRPTSPPFPGIPGPRIATVGSASVAGSGGTL